MDDPRKVIEFIERNDLGYILGNSVRHIIYGANYISSGLIMSGEQGDNARLMHLRDARQFLNVEIKRLSKKKGKVKCT